MNKVWPKKVNFRNQFIHIKNYLKAILYFQDKNKWGKAFHNAQRMIIHNNNMVEKLTNIYRDLFHYASFYISCKKSDSLGKHGDLHSEQNYSSIIAYMGQGNSLSIKEQIESLIRKY